MPIQIALRSKFAFTLVKYHLTAICLIQPTIKIGNGTHIYQYITNINMLFLRIICVVKNQSQKYTLKFTEFYCSIRYRYFS